MINKKNMDSFNTITAFAMIVLVIGLGDYISQRTKGYISLLFTATILFIITFATGMNKELFEVASFGKKVGWIAISLIITHLGTTLNIKTITAQWKTVILSVAVQIGIVAVLLFIVPFFFDWQTAIASVSACGGGIVAVIISQEAFEAHSIAYLSIFMVLLLSLKCLIGYPLASFMLRNEGRRLLLLRQSVPVQKICVMSLNKAAWPFNPFVNFSKKHNSFEIILAKTAIVTFLAYVVSRLIGFAINPYIICFVFGYLAKEVAFIEPDVLKKANSFGFLMLVNIAVIFSVLTMVDLPSLKLLWFPLLIIMLIALFAILITALIAGRLLGFSKYMSVAAGISCMFGFPGTLVIPSEVAKNITKTQEEHDYVFNSIFPVMLIAGFVNVTILSVIIAGVLIKLI